MRILIGCETSGIVRDAFRAAGHDAWSCDLLPSERCNNYHIQDDVLDHLNQRWDMAIFHPDCTYLCSSGLHWNGRRKWRAEKTEQALSFVLRLMDAPIRQIAIENPVGCIGTRIRPADQWVQPYEFGDDASKKTGLWLKGLKPLSIDPSERCPGRMVEYEGKMVERWSNQTVSGQNRVGPSGDRWLARARTYPGLAAAFVYSWG